MDNVCNTSENIGRDIHLELDEVAREDERSIFW